jgi:hypothetical protein
MAPQTSPRVSSFTMSMSMDFLEEFHVLNFPHMVVGFLCLATYQRVSELVDCTVRGSRDLDPKVKARTRHTYLYRFGPPKSNTLRHV